MSAERRGRSRRFAPEDNDNETDFFAIAAAVLLFATTAATSQSAPIAPLPGAAGTGAVT